MEHAGTTSPFRSLVKKLVASRPSAAATQDRGAPRPWVHRALPYVLTVASVAIALFGAKMAERSGFPKLEFPLFIFAVASTIWYPGIGPAILGVVLSSLSFNYWFTEPRETLFLNREEVPYFATFVLLSSMLTGFSVVRRRAEKELLDARERLEAEVAERKAHEERVHELNEQLERRSADLQAINGELEAFAYSVSHDLRAPLRHMVGFAELLEKSAAAALDDKSRRYLATMTEAARRMTQLIEDLLAFSRIGRAEARATSVRLGELVKEVVEELRPDTASRDVVWTIGELPVLHGDRAMLKQVIANLVANALKFTRTRERAKIEIGSFEDGRRGVVVFVKDNGVGFDAKYQDKLFHVFQRLHRTEEFEGTGVGLATVQRVIHRHGGTVWAQGAVDRGATFFFSLPYPKR